jgi:hypothetical protein
VPSIVIVCCQSPGLCSGSDGAARALPDARKTIVIATREFDRFMALAPEFDAAKS